MLFNLRSKKIQADQELFFNENSQKEKVELEHNIFYNYANKEQYYGFDWISDAKSILEYGCGTGTSLDIFFETRDTKNYSVFGIDIAQQAIEKAKKNYPQYDFYKISDNKIPQLPDASIDAAFMLHVLHHSFNHPDIFQEVHAKLKKGGKFFLSDLSSRSPFIRFGRFVFSLFSGLFASKFPEDLVVDGVIPDKYPVSIPTVIKQLERAGFQVLEVGEGHLFFFLFAWLDKFVPLHKIEGISWFYSKIIKVENFLIQKTFLKNYCEVFYIKCIK